MEFKKIAKDSMMPLKATLRVSGNIIAETGRLLFGTDLRSQKFLFEATVSLVGFGTALAFIDLLRGHKQDAITDSKVVVGIAAINVALSTIKSIRRSCEYISYKERFLDSASKVLKNDETIKLSILASANALTRDMVYEVLGEERFIRFAKQLQKDGLIKVRIIGLEAVLPMLDHERQTMH